jgi:hypothetical protein
MRECGTAPIDFASFGIGLPVAPNPKQKPRHRSRTAHPAARRALARSPAYAAMLLRRIQTRVFAGAKALRTFAGAVAHRAFRTKNRQSGYQVSILTGRRSPRGASELFGKRHFPGYTPKKSSDTDNCHSTSCCSQKRNRQNGEKIRWHISHPEAQSQLPAIWFKPN